jgi:hypothetical protein
VRFVVTVRDPWGYLWPFMTEGMGAEHFEALAAELEPMGFGLDWVLLDNLDKVKSDQSMRDWIRRELGFTLETLAPRGPYTPGKEWDPRQIQR